MKSMGWPLVIGAALLSTACSKESTSTEAEKVEAVEKTATEPVSTEKEDAKDPLFERAQQTFGTLPKVMEAEGREITDARVELGRALYFDPRMSKNQDISCATCHSLENFGVDPRPEAIEKGVSPGHKGQMGERNSPSVFNAALHIAQFWDGRAADVEEQAKGPILNPVEMSMKDDVSVVAVVKSIPGYKPMFEEAFGEGAEITYDNIGMAIGAFERKLVTPAPFDEYLAGKTEALSEQQKRGLDTFMSKGCTACHIGPGVGGTMYQKLGLIKPYETEDLGRFKHTGVAADKYFFKVPSLRNVAETAPYFHDGSIKTLEEAIRIMGEHQTPFGKPSDADVEDIVAFLKSLTGEPPAELIKPPELPESGPQTPKPDPS